MSTFTDLEKDAASVDGFVNENGLIPTRRNGPKPSYQYLVDRWTTEIAATILELNKSRGFRVVGTFADGFTYELFNDVGIDADGNSWIYVGAGVPNKVVPAGTVPSVSEGYEQVTFNDASDVLDIRGTNVQDYIDGNLTPFKTVSDMKTAAFLSTLPEFTRIEWQGYYSQSDGGGNWGVLRFGTHTEDGGSIFSITSNTYIEANLKGGMVSIKKFGCKGDGVNDDSDQRDAAFDYVSARSGTLFVPIGDYRVTRGYVNSGPYNDIRLVGEGVNRENFKTPQIGSIFTLDNTNPASFFYKQSSRHFLQVEGVIFRSAQYAGNRKYFIFDNGGASHNFQNCNFESVEKPINYTSNCYFQNAAFRDVQFRQSGTFHSESNSIVGTLLLLDNVNHEGAVPLNSDKVVCDLRGIREIKGSNFLLEGSLAESGWTVIRTDATTSTDWIQSPTMLIDGFHSEWSINHPAYVLDLVSGYYKFSNANAFVADTTKIRLNTKAKLVLEGVTISSGTPVEIEDYFELVDLSSTVSLENCGSRLVGQPLNPRITLNNFSRLDTDSGVSNTLISNDAPILLASFDGGYFDGDQTILTTQNGTVQTPTTDATHGRKWAITAGTAQRVWLSVINNENWSVGEQFAIKARVRLPTFTGGLYKISAHVNFTDVAAINYDSTNSAQIVEAIIPFRLLTSQTTLGVNLSDNNPTGVVGDFEVLTLEIYRGSNITNSFQTIYPKNITTYGSAAPTIGSWKQGDKIYDTTPSEAGFIGWVCTASGTPGTWKTFGAISS